MNTEKTNEEMDLQKRLDRIGHTFLILSGKGGVGKSTVAVNLALSLAARGLRTGLLDVDIHGPSVPKLTGLNGKRLAVRDDAIVPFEVAGIKVVSMGFLLDGDATPVIWRGPIKANVIKEFLQHVAWGDLDCLVVDCPPGTGDEPLSTAQYLSGRSSAVIVTTPQQVATIDVEKCITFCRQLNLPVAGLVENMSGYICPHCGKEVDIFSRGGGEMLAEKHRIPLLGKIPLDPDIGRSGEEGQPYVLFYGKARTADIFDEIADKIALYGSRHPVIPVVQASTGPVTVPEQGAESIEGREVSMRFAVPTSDGKLCAHFGHCETFALVDTDAEGNVVGQTNLDPPPHEPGLLPEWLSQQGVNCVIAGGMGSRAQQLFAQKGIRVVTGAMGEYPQEIVEHHLKGTLQTGANTCDH